MSLSNVDYVSVLLPSDEPLLLPEPKTFKKVLQKHMTPAQLHPFVQDASRRKHSAGAYSLLLCSNTHIALLESLPGYQSSKMGFDGMPLFLFYLNVQIPDGQLLQLTVSNEVATFGEFPFLIGNPSPQDVLRFSNDVDLNPNAFLHLQTSSAQSLQAYSTRTVIIPMPRDFRPNPPHVCAAHPGPQDLRPQTVIDLTTTTDCIPYTLPSLEDPC
eukprot:jgi/Botrbrau1/15599/Bobra.0264s0001.1